MISTKIDCQPAAPLATKLRPTFRSGAVARMAGMPVATLRIWEQRYQAVRPITAASGHRLYSSADVERATLLRRLTAQGHAIGLLAALETEQMREMMHAPELTMPANLPGAQKQLAIRAVVVGQALARRLQRLIDSQPLMPALRMVEVFDTLAEAAQAAQHSAKPTVDLLLWQASSLQPGARQELRVAQDAWRAPAAAVLYRFSSAAGRAELTGTGAAVLYEPVDDDSLFQWLASLPRAETPSDTTITAPKLTIPSTKSLTQQTLLPPRFGDAALTQFAGLSSAMACECPSHLAGLLLQVSYFETYSGECANRSEADAKLHAYLQQVAGTARMLFEEALEQVAIAEGLPLPLVPTASLL
ncbi:MerR family transcriptional regulator [Limnohabitans sp. Rim8]|uniref:MerR family transcriptional regulator n=1 Tax=Limnohabitans sp. Rim8 TaxID=1100718 RepID=UPI00262E61DC|nr:MerR family transcriptional regulator [Limnohabitans sp. Rim8]